MTFSGLRCQPRFGSSSPSLQEVAIAKGGYSGMRPAKISVFVQQVLLFSGIGSPKFGSMANVRRFGLGVFRTTLMRAARPGVISASSISSRNITEGGFTGVKGAKLLSTRALTGALSGLPFTAALSSLRLPRISKGPSLLGIASSTSGRLLKNCTRILSTQYVLRGKFTGVKAPKMGVTASGVVTAAIAAAGGFTSFAQAALYQTTIRYAIRQATSLPRAMSAGMFSPPVKELMTKFVTLKPASAIHSVIALYPAITAFSLIRAARLFANRLMAVNGPSPTGGFSSLDYKAPSNIIQQTVNITGSVVNSIKQFWY